jgi:protein O-mannose beta-1,4-N-acetylglucosaminyltransferase
MHLLHDDLLGWQDVKRHYNPEISKLWLIDDYGRHLVYDSIYDKVVKTKFEHLNELSGRNRMICFKDATVGNSKRLVWYQYGYKSRQSPVNHTISRDSLAEAFDSMRRNAAGEDAKIPTKFYWKRLQAFLKIAKGLKPDYTEDLQIVVFTRKRTRLLLNLEQLVERLQSEFNLPVKTVGLEDHTVEQIIVEMSKTAIAIGLHGSLLVMAGFMPPGAVLIEAFPYAVPPTDYQPYRELCRILGHRYRAWSSPHPDEPFTVGHPKRGKHEGGIGHLSEGEREAILGKRWIEPHKCCYDAAWLYRIFQDTFIDPDSVVELIKGAVLAGE